MLYTRTLVNPMFGKHSGDPRTLLPVSSAVTYQYTLSCASVVKHTPHPIALSGLKYSRHLVPLVWT